MVGKTVNYRPRSWDGIKNTYNVEWCLTKRINCRGVRGSQEEKVSRDTQACQASKAARWGCNIRCFDFPTNVTTYIFFSNALNILFKGTRESICLTITWCMIAICTVDWKYKSEINTNCFFFCFLSGTKWKSRTERRHGRTLDTMKLLPSIVRKQSNYIRLATSQ